jgi:phosphoribosylaminoimidazole-succinocarboxamide synthase
LWLAERGYKGEGEVPVVPEDVLCETAEKYIQAYEMITGQSFTAEPGEVLPRIEENLKPYAL